MGVANERDPRPLDARGIRDPSQFRPFGCPANVVSRYGDTQAMLLLEVGAQRKFRQRSLHSGERAKLMFDFLEAVTHPR